MVTEQVYRIVRFMTVIDVFDLTIHVSWQVFSGSSLYLLKLCPVMLQ